MFKLIVLINLFLFINVSHSAKILGVFPSPGYSQFILCEKLMTELVRRGHEVTVISPFKPKNPPKNFRTLQNEKLTEIMEDSLDLFNQEDENVFSTLMGLYTLGFHITEAILAHENVQNLINSHETFDLVIVEQFVNEAHKGFAEHFKTPLILFSSIAPCEWTNPQSGNLNLPSLVPVSFADYSTHMTFRQRIKNTAINLFDLLYKKLVVFPKQQTFLDKYFPEKMDIDKLYHNVSLTLFNSHPSVTEQHLLGPNSIEIGGFHVEAKNLPGDLQKILDDAKDGVILFTMGSNLKSRDLSPERRNGILRAFGRMKQTILWKFEDEHLPNKPDNVIVRKWLPQSNILAHPNVRLFITHGGLLGTTEAVHHGVPIVGVPIFGDQKMNINRAVKYKYGVRLPLKSLNEEGLYAAVTEVLENPIYRANVQFRSRLLKDRPVKPLDSAMYWIEYVIRYKGAEHLRGPAIDMAWYQIYLFDILGLFIFSVFLVYFILRLLMRKVFSNSRKQNIKLKTK